MTKQYQKIKRARTKADKEFHRAGIKKWGKLCNVCKKKLATCCHHYLEKGAYSITRYNLLNAVPICWLCHKQIHSSKPSLINKVRDERGEQWYNDLIKASQEKKSSYLSLKYYQEQYERLKNQ